MSEHPVSEELALDTPAYRLRARAWGPAAGTPVLALHGWLDNAASFAPLAPHLPGLRLVALDLVGHGRSAHLPPGMHYQLTDFVHAALWAADALGWERFALLGHSLGAAVALFTAVAAPARVERLALLDGLLPLNEHGPGTPVRLRRATEALRGPVREPRRHTDRGRLEASRRRAAHLTPEAARLLTERGSAADDGGVYWCHDPRLSLPSPFYYHPEQLQAMAAAVAAPMQLISARQGRLLKWPGLEAALARIPDCAHTTVEGGHHVHMDAPERVAAALGPFLTPA